MGKKRNELLWDLFSHGEASAFHLHVYRTSQPRGQVSTKTSSLTVGNGHSERLGNLTKITELGSGETGFELDSPCLP